jgi:hypothetical protein
VKQQIKDTGCDAMISQIKAEQALSKHQYCRGANIEPLGIFFRGEEARELLRLL